MIEWLFSLVVWLTPTADAEALRRTASSYLDVEQARAHVAAARVAAAAHRIDPDLLLAIAWRESRYQVDAVTREASGKLSCGLMMVTMPKGKPCPKWSVLDGYAAGAVHLGQWVKATRNQRDALVGYAGGYAMIEKCKLGPIERERAGSVVDLCSAPELRRAAWIRRGRGRMSTRDRAVW
jgi:hypothetical protein